MAACATACTTSPRRNARSTWRSRHITKRSTFGQLIADRQAVQFMLADCASELYIGRLMLLHIAYKAEKGLDIRQENSIAKIFHAHMVHKVIDTAIQLHGALGFSQDTPLAKWYTQVRAQRLVDGPDEVHKWKIGKNVIKAFREHGDRLRNSGRSQGHPREGAPVGARRVHPRRKGSTARD